MSNADVFSISKTVTISSQIPPQVLIRLSILYGTQNKESNCRQVGRTGLNKRLVVVKILNCIFSLVRCSQMNVACKLEFIFLDLGIQKSIVHVFNHRKMAVPLIPTFPLYPSQTSPLPSAHGERLILKQIKVFLDSESYRSNLHSRHREPWKRMTRMQQRKQTNVIFLQSPSLMFVIMETGRIYEQD